MEHRTLEKTLDEIPDDNVERCCSLNLRQCKELLKVFGGDDSQVTIARLKTGYEGPGLYAWFTEYAEEGSYFLGEDS